MCSWPPPGGHDEREGLGLTKGLPERAVGLGDVRVPGRDISWLPGGQRLALDRVRGPGPHFGGGRVGAGRKSQGGPGRDVSRQSDGVRRLRGRHQRRWSGGVAPRLPWTDALSRPDFDACPQIDSVQGSRASIPATRSLVGVGGASPPHGDLLIRPSRLSSRADRGPWQRGIEAEAERLRDVFRADWAHQPPLVEDALGKQMLALLVQLEAACTATDQLAEAVEEVFPQHPDAEILLSFPGLGIQLAARSLAEIGTTTPASPTPAA